jgi:hypothetical protein
MFVGQRSEGVGADQRELLVLIVVQDRVRLNCSRKSIEAKRNDRGDYEVKFSGNPDKSAVGSIVDVPKHGFDNAFVSFTRLGPGDFRVVIYNVIIGGPPPNEDRPFSIALP